MATEAGKRKGICAIEDYCQNSNTQSRPGLPLNDAATREFTREAVANHGKAAVRGTKQSHLMTGIKNAANVISRGA
jgi:hypothetical protein